MKLSLLLSASAAFLLAAAAPNEPSLSELLATLTKSDGVMVLGRDGVLRSLNKARNTVVDYVKLSKDQVTEYTKLYFPLASQKLYIDVDGHDVTSEAELLTVPDFIEPYDPTTSKPKEEVSVLENKAVVCSDYACDQREDCYEYNCDECVWRTQYCTIGFGGCINYYRCEGTLG